MAGSRLSKSQFVDAIAGKTGLTKKQIALALDGLNWVVTQQLGQRGAGEVVIPGLLKLGVVAKPATPAHEGINPFTKAPMTYKAKPARKVIRARPLKGLKDAV